MNDWKSVKIYAWVFALQYTGGCVKHAFHRPLFSQYKDAKFSSQQSGNMQNKYVSTYGVEK